MKGCMGEDTYTSQRHYNMCNIEKAGISVMKTPMYTGANTYKLLDMEFFKQQSS